MPITDFNINQGIATFIGSKIVTNTHKHHALEFIIAHGKPFQLITETKSYSNISNALILPDVPHSFIAGDDELVEFIFIDPDLSNVDNLLHTFSVKDTEAVCLDSYRKKFGLGVFKNKIYQLLSSETDSYNWDSMVFDQRISNCMKYIFEHLKEGDISLDTLSNISNLSKSRLSHLFTDQTGIPIKKFILWNRMKHSVNAIINGVNLTQAAYVGGFADSAHFSKRFKEMFGISPSSALKM